MSKVAEYAFQGVTFLLFGVWWTTQILRRYYRGRLERGPTYMSSLTFPCCCHRAKHWQLEGILKLLFSISLGITSLVAAFLSREADGQLNPSIVKYLVVAFFFGFSGVIDIIMVAHKTFLPRNTDYVFFLLAFLAQGFLQYNSLYGTPIVEEQLHLLIVYICFGTALCLLAEMRWPKNVLFALGRAFLVLLLGTWTFQISAILCNPMPMKVFNWDMKDPKLLLSVTEMFACHVWFIFIGMVLVAVIFRRLAASGPLPPEREDGAMTELIPRGERNGQDDSHLYEISDD
ncbi:transmembrane protein 45B-like [Lineus longissimus]|uniref:transmembrane protein 45B-like n=1 Tax=Lineus longissimus TaxID=88925 RepID=UPI002B4FA977